MTLVPLLYPEEDGQGQVLIINLHPEDFIQSSFSTSN